jgi:hypothetical protein
MFYKEQKNFLTKKELKIVNKHVLGDNFPWFFQKSATTEKFPFFSHGLYTKKRSGRKFSCGFFF